jgi:hypothetical protein
MQFALEGALKRHSQRKINFYWAPIRILFPLSCSGIIIYFGAARRALNNILIANQLHSYAFLTMSAVSCLQGRIIITDPGASATAPVSHEIFLVVTNFALYAVALFLWTTAIFFTPFIL